MNEPRRDAGEENAAGNADAFDSRTSRRRSTGAAHNEHMLGRDDFDHVRHREPAQLAALANLEVRGDVRIVVRQNPFDDTAPTAGE